MRACCGKSAGGYFHTNELKCQRKPTAHTACAKETRTEAKIYNVAE